MSVLRKRNGRYSVRFTRTIDGVREQKEVGLRTNQKRIAESLKSRLEADQQRGKIDVFEGFNFRDWKNGKKPKHLPAKKRLNECREEYLEACSHLAHKTIVGYGNITKLLSEFLGKGFYIDKLTEDDLDEFLDQDHLALVSKHSYLRTIKAFCSWLVQKKYLQINPAKQVNLPKSPDDLANKILDEDELEILISVQHSYISEHIRVGNISDLERDQRWFPYLVKFAFYTGLRRSEIINIKWKHVDLKNKLIHVVNGKGAKSRSVIILKDLYPVLEEWKGITDSSRDRFVFESILSTHDLSKVKDANQVSKAFKNIVKESELSNDIRFHSLRHSFATYMLNNGFDIMHIKELMGHSDLKTTQRYTHLVPQSILRYAEQHGKA